MKKADPSERRFLARVRDKKGVIRIYFRAAGKLTRLPDDESSKEFDCEYASLLSTFKPDKAPHSHSRQPRNLDKIRQSVAYIPASIGWFIERYLGSRDFKDFAAGTQKNYRKGLDLLRIRLGPALFVDLDPESIDVYTAGVDRDYKASAADQQRALISNLWNFAKGYKEFKRGGKSNPTIDTIKRYKVKQEHKPWPEAVQEKFLETAKPSLVLSYLLLRFTAQRGGDAAKMKWTDFDGESLQVEQEKTDAPLWLRCPKPLLVALTNAPRISDHILTSSWKRPWANASTLSHAIHNQLERIGAQGLVMHGLRKTAASDLADLGIGVSGIKSVTGHKSAGMALYYVRLADQRRQNTITVEAWDAALDRKAQAKVAKSGGK
jgi:integrase